MTTNDKNSQPKDKNSLPKVDVTVLVNGKPLVDFVAEATATIFSGGNLEDVAKTLAATEASAKAQVSGILDAYNALKGLSAIMPGAPTILTLGEYQGKAKRGPKVEG